MAPSLLWYGLSCVGLKNRLAADRDLHVSTSGKSRLSDAQSETIAENFLEVVWRGLGGSQSGKPV